MVTASPQPLPSLSEHRTEIELERETEVELGTDLNLNKKKNLNFREISKVEQAAKLQGGLGRKSASSERAVPFLILTAISFAFIGALVCGAL